VNRHPIWFCQKAHVCLKAGCCNSEEDEETKRSKKSAQSGHEVKIAWDAPEPADKPDSVSNQTLI